MSGTVVIEGDFKSIFGGIYRRAVALLIREAEL
jgi:hypothetical protein